MLLILLVCVCVYIYIYIYIYNSERAQETEFDRLILTACQPL